MLMKSNITRAVCLFFLIACQLFQNVHAQKSCAFDVYQKKMLEDNPDFAARLNAFEKLWQEKQRLMQNTASRLIVNGSDTLYEIPVVFHVIHTGSAIGTNFNPSVAKVQGVVDYLNQAFAATYPGYPAAGSGGVNIPIRFVLAKRDPSCAATNGITRTNGVTALGGSTGTNYDNNGVAVMTSTGISDAQLKGIIQWNPANYYNIWVVNKIDGWSGYTPGGGVVGYAQFAGGPTATDGTVIMEAFNDAGQTTLPHELGHAFNLYHTFQDGCVSTGACATNGDRVCDTDPHAQVGGCPTGTNPCTGTSWVPVTNNIMNYTDCTDRFTAGQSARAKTALLSQRGSLIQSLGGTDLSTPVVSYGAPAALSGCANPGIDNPGNTNDMGPSNIRVGSLSFYSGGYNADGNQVYVNHTVSTCLQPAIAPAYIVQGQTYPVQVSTGFNPENVRIWIDFNNNGSFGAGELVFTSDGTGSDQFRVHSGNTTAIPLVGVTTGVPLRMRVVSDFYGNSSPAACGGSLQYGQAEDFTVIVSTPLAVKLASFDIKTNEKNKSVALNWKSDVEKDLNSYEIERSNDAGKTFFSIGTQAATGADSKYTFDDAKPDLGTLNLYRLKMTCSNGKYEYSTVLSATFAKSEGTFEVYPNPASGVVHLKVPSTGYYDIKVINAVGQDVWNLQHTLMDAGTDAKFNLGDMRFAPGLYYFRIVDAFGNVHMVKFIKK